MPTLAYSFLFVAIGGALGAVARYVLNITLQSSSDFPWGTLAANFLGCLVMGVIAQFIASANWIHESGLFPEHYRLLFAVGFCGSFTTLSSFVLEMSSMLQRNEVLASFAYLMATMVGGFACFYIGYVVTRMLVSLLAQG